MNTSNMARRMSAAAGMLLAGAACSTLPAVLYPQAAATPIIETASWAIVEIPKQAAEAATVVPQEPPEDAAQAADVYPTPEPPQGPLITMEIVEDVILPPAPPQPTEPVETSGKYILVSIGEQHLYAYENGDLIYSFVASTGMGNSTRVGTFQILDRIPNAYGSTWNIWMPNWMGIYWSGSLENGIHALPILPNGARLWAGYLGTPISYGCVVLGSDEAAMLYDWAVVGTPVEIRW